MASSPQEWYFSVPPVTRAWLTAAVLSSIGQRFGLFNVFNIAIDADLIFSKFQIWRLLFNFVFFGRMSFPWLMQMVMLARYCASLESRPYPSGGGARDGNVADFIYMLTLGGIVLLAVGLFLKVRFMASALAFMVMYVWSKRNPDVEISLYMFKFKGLYLPAVLIGLSIVMGDDPTLDLIGLLAGHIYYFLVDALPNSPGTSMSGRYILYTPDFLYRWLGQQPTHYAYMGPGRPATGGPARPAAQFFQGTGRRLVD